MTSADRYRTLTVAEAAAFLGACGLPHDEPFQFMHTGVQWLAVIRPLQAWRLLKSGERKPTPISFSGVKGRIEKRHGELLRWYVASMNGDVQIAFRVLRSGL